jgi:hypothetical protein
MSSSGALDSSSSSGAAGGGDVKPAAPMRSHSLANGEARTHAYLQRLGDEIKHMRSNSGQQVRGRERTPGGHRRAASLAAQRVANEGPLFGARGLLAQSPARTS